MLHSLQAMGEGTIQAQNSKCRLYWCLIKFIDWRYSQSCWYFRPLLWTVAPTKYVHIKSTTVYAPRRNWDSPNPFLASECSPPPRNRGRGHTSLRVGGWGESQFRRGAYTVVLFICTYSVVAPLPSLWPPPPLPPPTVCDCRGGGGVVSCFVDHILQEFNTLCLTRFKTCKIVTPPQAKTPVKTTLRDWCL